MEIQVQLTDQPIATSLPPPVEFGIVGAWTEFRGLVRGEESGQPIRALEYEAYAEMAGREIRRLLTELSAQHPCLAARVTHRVGVVPVGEAAIYVGIASSHRTEGFALLAAFMDRLKQDVPIWKRRALPA
jgi:molybdopterin synthase catalytic subunit